ncbi:MAG TPA: glycine cleavage system aminomethyltransferase GcvT [Acidimicrobiia bacterium]|nr:glycine cleavage system aminomethyltransferase GcvT [Acidimicrobiia bacterium]
MSTESLRHSPLDAEHRALGARMVPFGGWDMPIQYESVLAEHRACRERAVAFDVSHLGSVRVRGPGARPLLQWALTNDLGRIAPGRAQYTHLLDPDDAHVVDDIIVWWVADDDFVVMPNASNTGPLVSALEDAIADHAGGATCQIEDITASRAVIAVQGPEARALVEPLAPGLAAVPRFAVTAVAFHNGAGDGADGFVAGTGYTGEDGIELHVPAAAAPAWWRKLLGAGLVPAGLGARDTLRLEAGLPLHGHELGPGITPLEAGLGWVVRFDKGEFRGRAPLLAQRERGVDRLLRGVLLDGRQVPRAGQSVLRADSAGDEVIGEVTSGNFSPMLERGIALAFLPPDVDEGTAVTVDVRGRRAPATVVGTPFVRR